MPKQIVRKFYGTAVLMMMACLPATASAANVVVNPGFETGNLSGWATSAPLFGIGVDNDPNDVQSGTYGAYFGSDPNHPTTASILSQQLTTTIGQQYTLTFWLSEYQADGLGGYFKARIGGSTLVSLADVLEQGFTLYTANFTAFSTTTSLEFQALNLPGFYGLDDISVTPTAPAPVPTPSGLTNLLAGLLAFGLLLWRRQSPC